MKQRFVTKFPLYTEDRLTALLTHRETHFIQTWTENKLNSADTYIINQLWFGLNKSIIYQANFPEDSSHKAALNKSFWGIH